MANKRNRKNRRVQVPKRQHSIDAMGRAFQDLRMGSRTSPVPSGTTYRRKPKHNDWSKED